MRYSSRRFARTGTLILLSLLSIFFASEAHASWLQAVIAKLQQRGRIVVTGDPLTDGIYYIDAIDFTSFAGEGCVINSLCQYGVRIGGVVYDGQLNNFLIRNCNKPGTGIVCGNPQQRRVQSRRSGEAVLTGNDSGSKINLRSAPSANSRYLGYGLIGDRVRVLRQANGEDGYIWYQVQFPRSGAIGWIRGTFVRLL
ncbi:MAG: SH3 domain-containing protein [Phormidium sp.]